MTEKTHDNAHTKVIEKAESTAYYFTDAEVKILAKMFKNYKVPRGLEKLYRFVNDYSYKNMTIDEAEKFFKA